MIDKIVLTPRDGKGKRGGLQIDLYGDLTTMLTTATRSKMMTTYKEKPHPVWAPSGALDSIGGESTLRTLSKQLVTAYDIGRPIPPYSDIKQSLGVEFRHD